MSYYSRQSQITTPFQEVNNDKDNSSTTMTTQDRRAQDPAYAHDMLGHTISADFWPDSTFPASRSPFHLDSCKSDFQLPRPTSHPTTLLHKPPFDLPQPVQLAKYTHPGNGSAAYGLYYNSAWNGDHQSVRQPNACDATAWPQEVKRAAATPAPVSSYHAYSYAPMHPMHQRFASMSSSGVCSDDRNVPASDHGSDLSSEYSDLFQHSGLSFASLYSGDARETTPLSTTYLESQQRGLPDFVVEELKRLKLENMALKRMAHEVVRINNSSGSAVQCSHHPAVTTATPPSRLQRVFDGADPVQVYSEASLTTAISTPCFKVRERERGAAASMWAPTRQSSSPHTPGEATVSAHGAVKPFKASDISAAELSRRVAMDEASSSSFPAYHHVAGTSSPFDPTLPSLARSRTVSRTSPPTSPVPVSLAMSSKLENAPASSLVAMILEKRGQEASLLLQQQLKSGHPERRAEIIDAICAKIVPLSHDRHGNFLVQGAIEARPETASHLKGAFVELTMSQFGCHVVQKALEGGEDVREAVTEELLGSRLDQTLTSRHSIHVWQRILETEWSRPQFREQIFAAINRQLKGRWARTARQETGSIICQNIFESAQPDEKAQCVKEVLEELDDCATNQWGVWVVQHIIEHGVDDERRAALQGLVRSASKLTLSQYGQKAVMSGLKTGDRQFLQDYVEAMCHSSQPRRPPLIDVCLAGHGIQIVTQLLTTVDQKTRDRIISTVRRNSVFLKGSKAGMKVHQLCERARAFAGY
ncbi:uncharacterized protein SRS1_16146 [Sporisorium reilianum f. sp. reilianum]|uniref:PUM-HD domain-containing protein n=1 Tax=Sporisorium reilianum f. sp. reilianum TaxID=72559 RepID=A0A2N8UL29_9BASI|nr:uncharacterized protein SRS1_16146 [Sporisorium reilianum f. sp. reilianum]